MGPVLLGVAVAAVVLAVPFASRVLRPAASGRAAGPRAAAPAIPAAGAALRPEAQPRGEATGPFGYDNGVSTGDAP